MRLFTRLLGLVAILASATAQTCTPMAQAAWDAGLTVYLAGVDRLVRANTEAITPLLRAALLDTPVDEAARLTVFIPNNDAWVAGMERTRALPGPDVFMLFMNHIVIGNFPSTAPPPEPVQAVRGQYLGITGTTVANSGGTANIVTADIETCSGTIHVIDSVLFAPPAAPPAA